MSTLETLAKRAVRRRNASILQQELEEALLWGFPWAVLVLLATLGVLQLPTAPGLALVAWLGRRRRRAAAQRPRSG